MEYLPFVLLAALCMLSPVLCLQCYDCTSIPGMAGTSCSSANVPVRTCEPMYDRCMAIKGSMMSVNFMMKNCSNSAYCAGSIPNVPSGCAAFNTSGILTSCEFKCCEGDLCDPFMVPTTAAPTTAPAGNTSSTAAPPGDTTTLPPPTGGAPRDVTCLAAVLFAFIASLF